MVFTDISNDGGQIGDYSASLVINDEAASSRDITLVPGQSHELTFTLSGNAPDHNIVQIDNRRGGFTMVRWTNWPLIARLATALGFLIWALWYLIHRKRRLGKLILPSDQVHSKLE